MAWWKCGGRQQIAASQIFLNKWSKHMKSEVVHKTEDMRSQRASGKRRSAGHSPAWLAWATLAALVFGTLPVEGRDQCYEWRKPTSVGSYGQRWGHAMAYDSDRGVVVLFGGERGLDGSKEYFDDTWEYDGASWKRINVAGTKPAPRAFHAMAYDPVKKRVVLAGGEDSRIGGSCDYYDFGDVWAYTSNGTNGLWVRLPVGDFNRSGHALVFDSLSQHIMSVQGHPAKHPGPPGFACFDSGIDHYTQLRESQWVPVPGSNTTNYHSVWGVGAAFDVSRGVVLSIGGFGGLPDIFQEFRPGVGEFPLPQQLSSRRLVATAYDSWRQRVVVVGGVGDYPELGEEVYEWDPNPGGGWVVLPRLPAGQGRAGAQMVYDPKRQVMVLTGGAGGGAPDWSNGGRFDDTWELWPVVVPQAEVVPADAQADVCGSITLRLRLPAPLSFQDFGRLRFRWRLDGSPIQDGPHFTGTATTNLTISPVQQGHAGRYDAIVWDDQCGYGARTSSIAKVTVNPGLQWVFRTTNGPSSRAGHAMVYDSQRRAAVLFGGRRRISGTTPYNAVAEGFNDLWLWDGATWTQRLPATRTNGWAYSGNIGWYPTYTGRPVQRIQHAMAYDSRRDRLVIFGGTAIDPDGQTQQLIPPLNDLWEWDGVRWLFKGTNGPPPRRDGTMTYDEQRGVTVFFGGSRGGADAENLDLWEWNGYQWTKRQPLPVGGYIQDKGAMAYDSFRRVVVYGPSVGPYLGTTYRWHFWAWDGTAWSSPYPGVPASGTALTLDGTEGGAMAFDAARRRTIWFGGWQSAVRRDYTALFDGANWTMLPTGGGQVPSPRGDAAMAYDPIRQVTVLFGGDSLSFSPSPGTNDTWELAAIDKPFIREAPVGQMLRVGETVQFHVSAAGPGPFSYQWYRSGRGPVQDGGRIQGAMTDTLIITDTQVVDGDYYHVAVRNQCGETTTQPVSLEYNPVFGVRSTPGVGFGADYQAGQLQVVWPQADAVLLQATSPAGPWEIVEGATSPFVPGAGENARFFRLRLPAVQ
jgi:hypothetical protein